MAQARRYVSMWKHLGEFIIIVGLQSFICLPCYFEFHQDYASLLLNYLYFSSVSHPTWVFCTDFFILSIITYISAMSKHWKKLTVLKWINALALFFHFITERWLPKTPYRAFDSSTISVLSKQRLKKPVTLICYENISAFGNVCYMAGIHGVKLVCVSSG